MCTLNTVNLAFPASSNILRTLTIVDDVIYKGIFQEFLDLSSKYPIVAYKSLKSYCAILIHISEPISRLYVIIPKYIFTDVITTKFLSVNNTLNRRTMYMVEEKVVVKGREKLRKN